MLNSNLKNCSVLQLTKKYYLMNTWPLVSKLLLILDATFALSFISSNRILNWINRSTISFRLSVFSIVSRIAFLHASKMKLRIRLPRNSVQDFYVMLQLVNVKESLPMAWDTSSMVSNLAKLESDCTDAIDIESHLKSDEDVSSSSMEGEHFFSTEITVDICSVEFTDWSIASDSRPSKPADDSMTFFDR